MGFLLLPSTQDLQQHGDAALQPAAATTSDPTVVRARRGVGPPARAEHSSAWRPISHAVPRHQNRGGEQPPPTAKGADGKAAIPRTNNPRGSFLRSMCWLYQPQREPARRVINLRPRRQAEGGARRPATSRSHLLAHASPLPQGRPAARAEGVDVELIDLISSSHSISTDRNQTRLDAQEPTRYGVEECMKNPPAIGVLS